MNPEDKHKNSDLPEAYSLRRKNQASRSSSHHRPATQLDFRNQLEKLEDLLGVSGYGEEARLLDLGQRLAERLVATGWSAEPFSQLLYGERSTVGAGWYLKTIEHRYDDFSSWGWQLHLSTKGGFFRRDYEHHSGRYRQQDAYYYGEITSRHELLWAMVSKQDQPNSNIPREIAQFFE